MGVDLFKPSVPLLESFLDYLKGIDQAKMYSNFGPVHYRFKERLAIHFKTHISRLELFSSGTMALVAAMQNLKKKDRPYCLLPSWTFTATAQSVVAAGLTPIFLDVELDSMQLTSAVVRKVPEHILEQVSVVLVVSPFGAPLELLGFEVDCSKYGFDILCDCAAGFESFKKVDFHTMISLHATKTFGIGEGGLLLSPSEDLIANARGYINFGFHGSRQSSQLGVNGKLSEFHAAIGLAALDLWESSKNSYYQKAKKYLEFSLGKDWCFQNGWGEDWVSSTCVIRFNTAQQKLKAIKKLTNLKIQTRDWWNQGCHLEPIFKEHQFLNFDKNTHFLAQTTLGIPFYREISEIDINQIFLALNDD